MGVHTVELQYRAVLHPSNRVEGVGGHQPELRPGMPGRLRRMGGGLDAGNHPDQAALAAPVGHDAFQSVDVVEVVDHDEPDAVRNRQLDLLIGLGVAVQDQPVRVGARLDRGEDLASAGHIEVKAFADHDSLNRRARERL